MSSKKRKSSAQLEQTEGVKPLTPAPKKLKTDEKSPKKIKKIQSPNIVPEKLTSESLDILMKETEENKTEELEKPDGFKNY